MNKVNKVNKVKESWETVERLLCAIDWFDVSFGEQFTFLVNGTFTDLPWPLKCGGWWLNHFIHLFPLKPWMHPIRSHGLVNLCTSGYPRWSGTWSSPTRSSLLFQCLPLLPAIWITCHWRLRRKKSLSISSVCLGNQLSHFSLSQVTWSPISFQRAYKTSTLALLFSLTYLLLVCFSFWLWHPCPDLILSGLNFPNLIPGCLAIFVVFLPSFLFLLLSSVCLPFVFEFFQDFLAVKKEI